MRNNEIEWPSRRTIALAELSAVYIAESDTTITFGSSRRPWHDTAGTKVRCVIWADVATAEGIVARMQKAPIRTVVAAVGALNEATRKLRARISHHDELLEWERRRAAA